MILLYLVRHGESTGNREGVLQGQSDYNLTETGKKQAQAVGRELYERLSNINSERFFDHIFCSDLSR